MSWKDNTHSGMQAALTAALARAELLTMQRNECHDAMQAAESALAEATALLLDWESYDPDDQNCEWQMRRDAFLSRTPAPAAPSIPTAWLDGWASQYSAPAALSEPDEEPREVTVAALLHENASQKARISELEQAERDSVCIIGKMAARIAELERELASEREGHRLTARRHQATHEAGMALRAAIDAAVVELESAFVMRSQDSGDVVCESVVLDVAEGLRAAQKAAT